MDAHDWAIRQAAAAFLREQQALAGDEVLSWAVLQAGFKHDGERISLLSMQGIFKPACMSLPLSIRVTPVELGQPRPYDDDLGRNGMIRYRYRGSDPNHAENAGLRELWRRRLPVIYLHGIVRGLYLPVYPALIVGDDPGSLTCFVEVDEDAQVFSRHGDGEREAEVKEESQERRRYVTRAVQVRVHQQGFRTRVLRAYRDRCAVCRLGHRGLLDAAHILPDGHARGVAEVNNGLSLCKLHHAAYDCNLMGITPKLVVEVREDIRRERDGPMLLHGLQGVHGQKISVPGRGELQPLPAYLEERFEAFRDRAV